MVSNHFQTSVTQCLIVFPQVIGHSFIENFLRQRLLNFLLRGQWGELFWVGWSAK